MFINYRCISRGGYSLHRSSQQDATHLVELIYCTEINVPLLIRHLAPFPLHNLFNQVRSTEQW